MDTERSLTRLAVPGAGGSQDRYPLDPSFPGSLLLSAALFLFPGYLMYKRVLESKLGFLASFYRGEIHRAFFGNNISPIIFWCFGAALLFLLRKRQLIRREALATDTLTGEVLPQTLYRLGTTVPAAELFHQMEGGVLRQHPLTERGNLLLRRCRGVLLGATGSTKPEELGRRDRDYMEGSYALVRYLIWAIPILGFIGTVVGISEAIQGFGLTMQKAFQGQASEATLVAKALKENLPRVTGSLATAFDTTYVALLLSMPVMLLMTWLEKIEDNYLSDIEELWQQQILPQLPGTRTGSRISLPNIPALPASTTDEATRPLSTDLQLLIAQMQALQQVVGDLQATLHQSLTIPRRLE